MKQVETEKADNGTLTRSIVEAVTEAKDVTYEELSPPLYEVIDTDALNQLFDQKLSRGKVVFNYNACEISVFSDGYITVKNYSEGPPCRA